MIRFRCSCGKKLKADETIIGRRVQCSVCGEVNRVPKESTAQPSGKSKTKRREILTIDDHEEIVANLDSTNETPDRPQPLDVPKFKGRPAKSKKKSKSKSKRKSSPSQSSVSPVQQSKQPSEFLGSTAAATDELLSSNDDASPDENRDHQTTSLLGDDEANDQASLIPTPDRFKQPPEFDPDPSEELIGASDSFDFDPDQIDFSSGLSERTLPTRTTDSDLLTSDSASSSSLDSETSSAENVSSNATPDTDSAPKKSATGLPEVRIDTGFEPRFKTKQENKTKPILLFAGGGLLVLAALVGVVFGAIWLFSGDGSYPASFESLAAVKKYRSSAILYDKSRRMCRVAGESYFKTHEAPDNEITEFDDFIKASKRDHELTLRNALELISRDESDQAKKSLRQAALNLDQERVEIEKRAIEYQKKGR
ncbi:MAG: hypothetical protein AAFN77_14330 [Planctomycetota bacterium]